MSLSAADSLKSIKLKSTSDSGISNSDNITNFKIPIFEIAVYDETSFGNKIHIYNIGTDSNSDRITNEGELISLEEAGISEISLEKENSNIESNGNIIGLEGTYLDINGEEKDMADVWFAYEENLENEAINLDISKIEYTKVNLVDNDVYIVNINFE